MKTLECTIPFLDVVSSYQNIYFVRVPKEFSCNEDNALAFSEHILQFAIDFGNSLPSVKD